MAIWVNPIKETLIHVVIIMAAYFNTHPLTAAVTVVGTMLVFAAKFIQVRRS